MLHFAILLLNATALGSKKCLTFVHLKAAGYNQQLSSYLIHKKKICFADKCVGSERLDSLCLFYDF